MQKSRFVKTDGRCYILRTEYLRINIGWSALAPLSQNNLQTGYGSNSPRSPRVFPVSLRAIGHQSSEWNCRCSVDPRRARFHERRAKKRAGLIVVAQEWTERETERRIRPIGRNARFARWDDGGYDLSRRVGWSYLTHPAIRVCPLANILHIVFRR